MGEEVAIITKLVMEDVCADEREILGPRMFGEAICAGLVPEGAENRMQQPVTGEHVDLSAAIALVGQTVGVVAAVVTLYLTIRDRIAGKSLNEQKAELKAEVQKELLDALLEERLDAIVAGVVERRLARGNSPV